MTVKLGDKVWHKRHHDFESFDRITLEVKPRYKTSGLSGDEWRQHVQINFYFKGHLVHECGYHSMRSALMLLPNDWIRAQEPIPDAILKIEEDTCDQPSCTNPPTHRYLLKECFSDRGEKLDKDDRHGSTYFRKFCQIHGTRGDCGREDSDDNYTKEAI